MYTLGISAFYHDSAAVLLKDGIPIVALEEERFSRIKHDNAFPKNAALRCLRDADITITDIAYIAYYEKPLLKFERILDTFVRTYPRGLQPFMRSMPEWLGEKINVEHIIRKELGFSGPVYFSEHHRSHAASTFFTSPFERSAVLSVDGVGEYETTSMWLGERNTLTKFASLHFPHSLGLLYSTFTAYLGFRVNDDEYKVMGLAAYGSPKYKEYIYKLVTRYDDGSFALNMKYFSYRESFRMWSAHFERLFGKQRKKETELGVHEKDIAASIQAVTEDLYMELLTQLHKETGSENLCVSGGVGLNSLANGKIIERTPFTNVHIMGAAGDSGGALGAALGIAAHFSNKNTVSSELSHLNLGTSYEDTEIETALRDSKLIYKKVSKEELIAHAATELEAGRIVGWFEGKMEFGPRSLGARSILADPRRKEMKNRVNEVKRREAFRPFACSILEEHAAHYFYTHGMTTVPFMNFCFAVREEKRSALEAVVHQDQTTRIQTVTNDLDRFHLLITSFFEKTGVPAVLNTSFNVKGQPIVETPKDALHTFATNPIDVLYIGNYIVSKC